MSLVVASSESFPKSLRLLKRRDFRFWPYHRFQTPHFNFVFTREGEGRLGVSISKKLLRRAAARNRVRRLLREAFRLRSRAFKGIDVHVVGSTALSSAWKELRRQDVDAELDSFLRQIV